ncbi:SUKH-3 domain-containing protein [Sorangium sp. So ce1504]|uniref:SUKH-3 domain-containing protein n=1 Tax=Sorangium sp. So ce1504 TaxID=3133337 RepID=UPI003F6163EF
MSDLDLPARLAAYPAVLNALVAAGWTPDRRVPLPSDAHLPGFVCHAYAEAFLASFGGLRVRVPYAAGGITQHRGFDVALGPPFEQMDAVHHAPYIEALAGTAVVYPVLHSGDAGTFVLEDGRALSIGLNFLGYVRARDPFQILDWHLRGLDAGVRVIYLADDERPPAWRGVW